MRISRLPLAATALAALTALALPGQALAVDLTTTASGTVAPELSLSVTTPAAMTFSPSTDGTSSSAVTVTSTAASWTLSVRDASLTTPGYMDRVTGTGPTSLASPLEWKLSTSSTWTGLSGTAATVATGSLIDTKTVDLRQQIGATEAVAAGDAYSIVLTFTVT